MDEDVKIVDTPYAEWLEGMIEAVLKHKPTRIGVCMLMEGGEVCTGYYGECYHQDKALMAYNIQLDAIGQALGPEEDEEMEA